MSLSIAQCLQWDIDPLLRARLGPPKHEALAHDLRNAGRGARAVGQLAGVVLVVDFREVEREVLPADLMVRAVQRPLRVAEEAFDRVGRSQAPILIPGVFFLPVANGVVRGERCPDLAV